MTALNFVGRNCAFLIRSATWATFCYVTYLIHLILKTKPKSLFGVPIASSLTLELMLSPAVKVLSNQIILYVILWCCALEDGLS